MSLSRRDFLRYSGASATGAAVGARRADLAAVEVAANTLRIKEAQVFPGVCPYCAVGCAQLIYVKDGAIRLSMSFFNNEEDVERTVRAIAREAAGRGSSEKRRAT